MAVCCQNTHIQNNCQSTLEWTSQQTHPPRSDWCSEKLQKSQKIHLRLSRPQLARKMLKFVTLQLKKNTEYMAHVEEWPGESVFSLRRTCQHSFGLQRCI